MLLKNLYLRNFRNFAQVHIPLAPQINTFCGANAQGKTTILEALHFLSTGRSFRTPHLKDLIKEGESHFYIGVQFEKDSVDQQIEVYYDGKEKRVFHNQTRYSSFSSLLGLLPSVVSAPSDQELIDGTPAFRRRFINIHIAQYDPLFVYHLARFYKALQYRNILLKKDQLTTVSSWEEEMAKSAAYLITKRHLMILDLQSILPKYLSLLTDTKEEVAIRYLPSVAYQAEPQMMIDAYKSQLAQLRKKDALLKTTSIGPHRDDLIITIDHKLAKPFASEGQKRTFTSALRLAAWDQLSSWTNEKILYCVDDMGMQLDKKRKELLMQCLSTLPQVCITAPHEVAFPKDTLAHTLFIHNGAIKKGSIPDGAIPDEHSTKETLVPG